VSSGGIEVPAPHAGHHSAGDGAPARFAMRGPWNTETLGAAAARLVEAMASFDRQSTREPGALLTAPTAGEHTAAEAHLIAVEERLRGDRWRA
jgi:hypothetical protein